ncbi:super-infection exclusion protein B [Aeromonas veronii]|uniref:super-infection exclusion protein B n=1 Tax=Aeromonas veronii TaxID=654 RepID=UPI001A8C14E0|nr:super-infection exclusion protein B [Aeromonas veronii]QSR47957.1 super-infection exclusion protein B [Aeromonas veronii]
MDISTITSALKLPKKAYFLGSIISGVMLFTGDEFLKKLSLLEFKKSYTLWIGIVFLLSIGMVLISIGDFLIEQYKTRKVKKADAAKKQQGEIEAEKKKAAKSEVQKYKLQNIDNYEKAVLREFYIAQKNTIEMSFEDPTVIGLINKEIIRQVGNRGYRNNITGGIAFFRADDTTVEYFGRFEFPELQNFPRPSWIDGLRTLEAYNRQVAELGKMIQRI